MQKWIFFGIILGFLCVNNLFAQDNQEYKYKPLKLSLNEDGSQYIRFILWHQQWASTNNLKSDNDLRLSTFTRRSRFLMYAQMTPKLLILSHWGVNNMTSSNVGTTASSQQSALFLHGAWVEFKINDAFHIGTGLHYFNGLTRLSSQSTLNFLGMDNPRPFVHWHALGVTDQFARHLGIYAKGEIDQFSYRVSINSAASVETSLGGGSRGDVPTDFYHVNAVKPFDGTSNTGDLIYQGYFNYQFMDKESTKLPYWVGSYMGKKDVFNVGAGFFYHPGGMIQGPITTQRLDDYETQDIFHVAIDAFYDKPINEDFSITSYTSIINFNYYDANFMNRWSGTGINVFTQLGVYLKKFKTMPYFMFQYGNYNGLNDPLTAIDLGVNYYVMGHNAKITLEFHNIENFGSEGGRDANGNPIGISQIRAQAHIFF